MGNLWETPIFIRLLGAFIPISPFCTEVGRGSMGAMALLPRQGRHRRRAPRGGRRPDDVAGCTPLVFLVDEDRSTSGDVCETLLETLRFAVARVDSVARAVTLVSTLLPDVIVARARDVAPLQRAAWPYEVPVVTVTAKLQENGALIHAIRTAVRKARSQG